jgi:hypothetical protein
MPAAQVPQKPSGLGSSRQSFLHCALAVGHSHAPGRRPSRLVERRRTAESEFSASTLVHPPSRFGL